jgi:tRNA 2-(methylsulfanyl)-N6-isopentenyladenosine37 hydroxylase
VAALIEARSCERFRLLADALLRDNHPLADFYEELFVAEARHYRTFLDMAIVSVDGDDARVKARLKVLAHAEGELCSKLGTLAEIHG